MSPIFKFSSLIFTWTCFRTHVLVMIGDEVPHEKNDNPRSLDWREELQKLKNMGVVVHGVQALNRRHAGEFYAECARVTGGVVSWHITNLSA